MEIIFTNIFTGDDVTFHNPSPASKNIPDWYKNISSYTHPEGKVPSENGISGGTIKKCMPVFDAMTAGYLLFTPVDLHVKQKNGAPFFIWPGFGAIEFHDAVQTLTHPAKKANPNALSPKWINPWAIRTPIGYSVLIIPPMHRDNVFNIMPGVIDTDEYVRAINLPFVLKDETFEGLIPAGTPMAQVIPFKREKWQMRFGDKENRADELRLQNKMLTMFWDRYKRLWWHKKDYT